MPQLDEAMADTTLDILADGPAAEQEQAPDATQACMALADSAWISPLALPCQAGADVSGVCLRQEPASLPIPACSQPSSLPGTPSAAAAAAHMSPAVSPCAPVPAADVASDSRDTSSQESNEPLRVAGGGRLSRKSRSAMSSRQSLAAEAGDQADTPRKARRKAHAMLDLQREQMEKERCQLQVRPANRLPLSRRSSR